MTGVTKTQMETSMHKTLAKQFNVPTTSVSGVSATESRRLMETFRRLAGNWVVSYAIEVPATQASAITSKIATLAAAPDTLKAEMKTQLAAAGVAQSAIDTLAISSFAGAKAASPVETSGAFSGLQESGKYSIALAVVTSSLTVSKVSWWSNQGQVDCA
jgi:hypothetical protein